MLSLPCLFALSFVFVLLAFCLRLLRFRICPAFSRFLCPTWTTFTSLSACQARTISWTLQGEHPCLKIGTRYGLLSWGLIWCPCALSGPAFRKHICFVGPLLPRTSASPCLRLSSCLPPNFSTRRPVCSLWFRHLKNTWATLLTALTHKTRSKIPLG